jgi:hypothetical protein
MNWAVFALVVTGIMTATWLFMLVKSQRSATSIYVSLGFLVLAGMNSAAPIRGFVDPSYVGYGFGLLRADKGLVVTLIAGSVFILSAICAFIAARNRAGRAMWLVAATCAAFTVIQGWPWLEGVLTDPSSNAIQFGEHLTIPGLAANALLAVLLVLPFLLGAPWASRRALAFQPDR